MQLELKSGDVLLFDQEDAELVASRSWRYAKCENKKGDKFYVSGRINGKHVYLHRVIAGAQRGQFVDHINGNTLDNRRSNLRIVTPSQNMQNRAKPDTGKQSSRFKGVCRVGRSWRAFIRPERHQSMWLGSYQTEVEAAYAYDVASLQYHGPFGKRNFLPLM